MRAFRPNRAHSALHGISAERIAEWCDVHITTARRWKRGEEPPQSAIAFVTLKSGGDLGVLDSTWSGWRLVGGNLVAPDLSEYSPSDVMAGPFWRRLAMEYQRVMRQPLQSDWVAERWEPARANLVESG